ncbi:hypothetical protein COLO4_14604 [Corchorus olitorius]|uniref:Uncharacterized protein n=1 Tax=Corchorus olitorius TaxID=93759 RepID=A0A1R3JRH8_9ROSI|nr:hypothetical protein COLO4_14604 [Corchorus olitorius]
MDKHLVREIQDIFGKASKSYKILSRETKENFQD